MMCYCIANVSYFLKYYFKEYIVLIDDILLPRHIMCDTFVVKKHT